MTDEARIHLLDELAANATAAPVVRLLDGWVLRAAPDLPFRRSNCALVLGGPAALTTRELDGRLRHLEDFYARAALPPRVQITPVARPVGLDAALAARGYAVEAPVDVLVADLRVVLAHAGSVRPGDEPEPTAEVSAGLPDAWVTEYARAFGTDTVARSRIEAYGRMLRDLALDAVAVAASRHGEIAGVGLGVLERGWLGIYAMGTQPAHRQRGVGTAVLRALAGAAAARGVRRAYLQVEHDNETARRLYEQAGFRLAYGYHYRLGDADR